MGLDFIAMLPERVDAHWAYSGFHRFRERLAKEAGFDLSEMEGFKTGGRPWDDLPEDDIHPLLNHSDCDGTLTWEECAKVGPRLRELVDSWPEDDYDRHHALLLADAMDRIAEEEGESFLQFT